jgi:hypothetical protein
VCLPGELAPAFDEADSLSPPLELHLVPGSIGAAASRRPPASYSRTMRRRSEFRRVMIGAAGSVGAGAGGGRGGEEAMEAAVDGTGRACVCQ